MSVDTFNEMADIAVTDLYKVLGPEAQSIHGGKGTWHKPKGKRPGKWMDEIKTPHCCERGYHLVALYSLPEWLAADCTIYLAEGRGDSHTDGSGKTAFAQARLIRQLHISEQDLRLFAADCAEHVLPIWEKQYPKDDRPARAIEAARRFARGEIDAAARAAAADAAWTAAAGDAAADAAWTAAWTAAGDAAGAAAWTAAWAAAADAAADAAWNAARAAAGAAAADAAWNAARAAAGAAAADAAADAAGNAARAAAADAERQWQSEALRTYLKDAP